MFLLSKLFMCILPDIRGKSLILSFGFTSSKATELSLFNNLISSALSLIFGIIPVFNLGFFTSRLIFAVDLTISSTGSDKNLKPSGIIKSHIK